MHEFFFGSGTGHSLMILVFVIGIGLLLGKIKIKNLSLGPVWILFSGIALSAFGVKTDPLFLHFIKEFGLVLFVFCIGLQVGPGFFSSLKGKGLKLNLLSILMIALSLVCVGLVCQLSGKGLPEMVGVLSGAVTNTPSMGTAQQTFYDTVYGSFLREVQIPQVASEIAGAFTVAYPIGILCTLLVLALLKRLFKNDPASRTADEENEIIESVYAEVVNPSIEGMTLSGLETLFHDNYVVTSLMRDGKRLDIASNPPLVKGDTLSVDVPKSHVKNVEMVFGKISRDEGKTIRIDGEIAKRNITVTKSSLTGKRLGSLDLLSSCGVTVTQVNRSDVSLIAHKDLTLRMGDSLTVIGPEKGVRKAAEAVGNRTTELEKPNLIPIFLGIALGLVIGAIPFRFPGMTHSIRLGLAGGCLIVSILLGHFGPQMHISTYTTSSANRMVRELGLCLMLGAIGLGAGSDFSRLFSHSGGLWIGTAALIALVPPLVTAFLAKYACKLSFSEIAGLLTGSSTNAEVLSSAVANYGDERISESYATVYPMSMFLRVIAAEALILIAFA